MKTTTKITYSNESFFRNSFFEITLFHLIYEYKMKKLFFILIIGMASYFLNYFE